MTPQMMKIESNIKLLLLNDNGLSNPVKRYKVMIRLRKDRAQIISSRNTFFQENERLKRSGYYMNTFDSSSTPWL